MQVHLNPRAATTAQSGMHAENTRTSKYNNIDEQRRQT